MELEQLIQSVNIVEYISQFVELTQKGDEYWGLSCFKDEKTPSFSVRSDPPVFYDYSSGIGGNVFTFTKYYNKCSGDEAIDILKKYIGYDGTIVAPTNKLLATSVCKKYSIPTKPLKQSLNIILDNNYMERYEKKQDKLKVWMDEGISADSLDKFEVRYDSFSDRLVYPIRDVIGNIVNVGGRTLDPNWKEKKLRKYTYFHPWGEMNTIYGISENLEHIKDKHEIIIFEGCKSVLLADSWGINNTAAILTSHLSPNQMKILARLGCDVVFALDKDVNIKADHNIKRLKHYVNVSYIYDKDNLLNEKDAPVDKGQEIFETLYHQRLKYR